MSDYKYPSDGDPLSTTPLNSDVVILFPEERMDDGFNRTFEIVVTDATAFDSGVKFSFFSGLDAEVFSATNVAETIESADIASLTGKLVFHRSITNTLDTAFKIAVTGTNGSSTASFLIRARSE